jgi:stage II sporulation SpoAA-like protein
MSMSVQQEQNNVYRLDLRGTLRKHDFQRCQDVLIGEMGRVGNVRLLFVLDGFEGWDPKDDWRDMSFYTKYGSSIDRIAIVGDERWRAETLMFAGADLRRAPVQFFAHAALDEARQWLDGSVGP